MSWRFALFASLGGSIGSMLRFWIGTFLPFSVVEFAWATFLINLAGCFAMGVCYPLIANETFRALIIVGLLGGFSTFSGIGLEVYRYMMHGSWIMATIYGGLSLILGTVLVWLGHKTVLLIQ